MQSRQSGGHKERNDAAAQAVLAADESRLRAGVDRERARRLRQDSEAVAASLSAHNVANRYDEWIMKVVKGQ